MTDNKWARLLAYVTGLVNQKLLLQNEYLAAENRILRSHLPARLRLSDPQRSTLAEIGRRLGRTALQQVACAAKPDTILAWYRRLIARKFDGSKFRSSPGRPRITPEVEALIVRFARENSGWGYDRIVGSLANLGHVVSDQTVGNILRRYGIQPAPRRSQNTTWKDFIASHLAVLAARRTGEIGIRMALGAPRRSVIWMVLGEVLLLAGLGLAISIPAALLGSKLVRSFLYQTEPHDPLTMGVAAALLVVAATLAGYLPARSAAKVDPMSALRHE